RKSPAQATVIVDAYNALGGHTAQAFTVQVQDGNRPPAFAPLPAIIQRAEGQPVVLRVSATDPDGDPLVYWADRLPGGGTFDPASRTLLWTPDYHQAGTYNGVTFFASDGVNQVSTSVTFLVTAVVRGPSLARPADRTLSEGDPLRFTLQGSQPDGYPVTYS